MNTSFKSFYIKGYNEANYMHPFKILNYDDGVNFTSGLSFIRTSPCHGTAYDIVGKNIGNEKSLLNAIKLANLINKNRNNA